MSEPTDFTPQPNRATMSESGDAPTPDAFHRAVDTLNQLQEDLAIFRDPNVRNYLDTLPLPTDPSTPAPPLPTTREPSALQATIISLRTHLSSVQDALRTTRAADLRTRKRAARAEGQLAELQAQSETATAAHKAALDSATDRLRAVEREAHEARTSAADERARAADAERRLTAASETAAAEHRVSMADADGAAARANDAETALLSAQTAFSAEKRQLVAARDRALADLAAARAAAVAVASSEGVTTNVPAQTSVNDDATAAELAAVREDLRWRSADAARAQAELAVALKEKDRLRGELARIAADAADATALRKEVARLTAAAEGGAVNSAEVEAMRLERSEMAELIRVVGNGNPAEGLAVLRKLAAETTGKGLAGLGNVGGKAEADGVRAAQRDKEKAVALWRKSERLGKALRKEVEQLRCVLKEIEKDSGEKTDGEVSAQVKLLQSRVDTAMSAADVHRVAAEEAERELAEVRAARVGEMERVCERLRVALVEECKSEERADEWVRRAADDGDVGAKELLKIMTSEPGEKAALAQRVGELERKIADVMAEAELLREQAKDEEGGAKRVRNLEEQIRKLRVQADDGWVQGESDYDSKLMKVIHLAENPLRKAIARYTAEVDRGKGKKRVRVESSPMRDVEGGQTSGHDKDLELKAEVEELQREREELKRQAKVGLRTKEIALKRIEEVRSAVYNLFGWSMKVNGAMYSISSIYAEQADEELKFALNEVGSMSLMESEYANELREEMEQYVGRMKSFPALLAHVTMSNFEKTTAML